MTDAVLPITGDEVADGLLTSDPLALLLGMLLDQQVPMEWAFRGPATIAERLGGLDATRIAAMDVGEFVAICAEKPAIHRFPSSMGERVHQVCEVVAEEYGGDASRIWTGVGDAAELRARLERLPGYGEEKSRIFVALLAKRFGVRPEGGSANRRPSATPNPVRWPTSTPRVPRPRPATGRR
ncbi:MAG: HhH-GPD-type base excision DNA repair protein [Microthrixaceae bacterium]